MGILIDTSSLIAAERGELDLPKLVRQRGDEPVGLAAITAAELLHGVHRLKSAAHQARAERFVERVLDAIPVIDFDLDAARVHARLGAELAAKGTAVGAHDLIIAATAVSLDWSVATRDLRSFPRIKGLEVEKW